MVYMLLADGFEMTEAVCPLDILRRAGVEVKTLCVGDGDKPFVRSSHGVTILADGLLDGSVEPPDAVILPGGKAGTENLAASPAVTAMLKDACARGAMIAAICAAPSVPGRLGLLEGRRATCYPGFEKYLYGAEYIDEGVVTDIGDDKAFPLITARAMGSSAQFGYALVTALVSPEAADEVKKAVIG